MTDPTEFSKLRGATGLTIAELAPVLGFSARTLSRWENGTSIPRASTLKALSALSEGQLEPVWSSARFRFIDLFAGIGGFRLPFSRMGGRCVFTSEWNKYSQQTYLANFPGSAGHQMNGDITGIHESEIPEHDLLLAGFPCQPFSIAGVSKKNSMNRKHGFQDATQGTLFFDIARIIAYHRPKCFLLENVKNLASHDKGNTFKVICQTLEEDLGYKISFRVVDAKGYVPQHRERVFILGWRDDQKVSMEDIRFKASENGPRLDSVLHREDGSEVEDERFVGGDGRVLPKYTLTDKLWEYLQAYAEKHKSRGTGFGFGLVTPEDTARTLSARYFKDGSEILVAQKGKNPRRLTPRECARLMGFENPQESRFAIPVSDTQAYKQFGNAVVVPVIQEIALALRDALSEKSEQESPQGDLLLDVG